MLDLDLSAAYTQGFTVLPYLAQFSRYRPKQCYHGGQQTNMATMTPLLKRTENKWAYMLALLNFLSAPSLKEIQFVLFELL